MRLKKLEQLKDAVIEAPLKFEFGGVLFDFTAKVKLASKGEIAELTSGGKSDFDIVKSLLVGWDKFEDEGQSVEFSQDVLNELAQYDGIIGRISVECINAQYRVQEKN